MLYNEFISTPFSPKTWHITDNDGTLSPFVPNPKDAAPNADLMECHKRLLDSFPDSRFTVMTGRPSTFLESVEAFKYIIENYPDQANAIGFYSEMKYDASGHEVSDFLQKYEALVAETLIPKLRAILEAYVDWFNSKLEADMQLSVDELCEFIIEDKTYGMGIHRRRILNHLGVDTSGANIVNRSLTDENEVKAKFKEIVAEVLRDLPQELPVHPKAGADVDEIAPKLDKVLRFKEFYESVSSDEIEEIYFYGDDLGDQLVCEFIFEINQLPRDFSKPKLSFIMIDSSAGRKVTAANSGLMTMREKADLVISPTDKDKSNAVAEFAEAFRIKADLTISVLAVEAGNLADSRELLGLGD